MKSPSSAVFSIVCSLAATTTTNAFSILPPIPNGAKTTTTVLFASNIVGVFYGTSTGSTMEVANLIVEQCGEDVAEGPFDVDDKSIVESFSKYDSIIVGTPTWNTGADTERSGTGWDELYYGSAMTDLDLSGKKVAVFGLGDSVSYAENFSDAAGELHDVFEKWGCKMFGYVSQEGYLHEDSKSIRGDKFCGLLCDVVNQEDLTEERVEKWVAQLKSEGFIDSGSSSVAAATPVAAAAAAAPFSTSGTPVVASTPEQVDEIIASLEDEIAELKNPHVEMTPEKVDEIIASLDKENRELKNPDVEQTPEQIDALIASLEAENLHLRKVLDLEEGSALLDESITTHDTGYTPHTNPISGQTMWTSADGRSCYFTDCGATTSKTSVAAAATCKQSKGAKACF